LKEKAAPSKHQPMGMFLGWKGPLIENKTAQPPPKERGRTTGISFRKDRKVKRNRKRGVKRRGGLGGPGRQGSEEKNEPHLPRPRLFVVPGGENRGWMKLGSVIGKGPVQETESPEVRKDDLLDIRKKIPE